MASGRKNYFRHSFFARNDEVILELIDQFSYKGYFFWFALLEICGEQASDEYPEKFKFHQSRLYRELRCNKRSLEPVLDFLQGCNRLVWNKTEKYYEIDIANFPKYLGKYTSKTEPNSRNKRKEKKNKENNIMSSDDAMCNTKNNLPLDTKPLSRKNSKTEKQLQEETLMQEIVDLWNKFAPQVDLACVAKLNQSRSKKLRLATKEFSSIEDWKKIFKQIPQNPFNLGQAEGSSWKANFDWLFRNDNYIKLYEEFVSDPENK